MTRFYVYIMLALLSFALGAYLIRVNLVSRRSLSLISIALLIPSTIFLANGSFLVDFAMHILFMILFQLGVFTEVVLESVTSGWTKIARQEMNAARHHAE